MSTRSASSWCLVILGVATLFGGATSTGSAGISDKLYTASFSPATAAAGTTTAFTFRLTNSAASSQPLGSANVTIPAGFAIVSLGPAVAPAGKKWTVTNVSGVLQIRSGAAKDRIDPGQFADFPLTITAPCVTGSSTWATAVKQSNDFNGTGNDFVSEGADPSINVTSGPLGSFAFAAIASPRTAGTPFGVSVTARDVCGHVKADYAGGATLGGNLGTAPNGTAPSYGSLSFVAGVGTATVTAYKAETGRTLTVTHGAVSQTSGSFAVAPGAPHHLVFTQQPTRTAVNQPIAPGPAVQVRDQYDNVATQASGAVSLALGNNPSNTTLGGALSVTPTAGLAAFANVTVGASEIGYTFVATSADIAGYSKTSAPFDVVDTLVNCPSSGCKASASNALTFVEVNVPSKPGTSSDPLAISLSGTALPFTCDGVTALSVGALTTIDPPPGYTAQNPISVTWRFPKEVAPGTGVANFVFCKNSGPGTPFHVVLDCAKNGPPSIPCVEKRNRNGVGELVLVVLMTSGDPVGGTR